VFVPALPDSGRPKQDSCQENEDTEAERAQDPVAAITNGLLDIGNKEERDYRDNCGDRTDNFRPIEPVQK
jgi:hypothetical protein